MFHVDEVQNESVHVDESRGLVDSPFLERPRTYLYSNFKPSPVLISNVSTSVTVPPEAVQSVPSAFSIQSVVPTA